MDIDPWRLVDCYFDVHTMYGFTGAAVKGGVAEGDGQYVHVGGLVARGNEEAWGLAGVEAHAQEGPGVGRRQLGPLQVRGKLGEGMSHEVCEEGRSARGAGCAARLRVASGGTGEAQRGGGRARG